MNSSRTKHLTWCKAKALAELSEGRPEQISQTLQTLISDLVNNPETHNHPFIAIVSLEACNGLITTKEELVKFLARFD